MMTIFDSVIDKALSSSSTVMKLAQEMVTFARELKTLKETVVAITHAVRLQQIAIDDLFNAQLEEKKFDIATVNKKNEKKEKPN